MRGGTTSKERPSRYCFYLSESDRTRGNICGNVCRGFRTDVIVFISVSLIGRVGIFVVMSVEASELTLLFLSL